eukprot:2040370-Pleurochrysis_carterae.AAC.1
MATALGGAHACTQRLIGLWRSAQKRLRAGKSDGSGDGGGGAMKRPQSDRCGWARASHHSMQKVADRLSASDSQLGWPEVLCCAIQISAESAYLWNIWFVLPRLDRKDAGVHGHLNLLAGEAGKRRETREGEGLGCSWVSGRVAWKGTTETRSSSRESKSKRSQKEVGRQEVASR